MSKEGWLQQGEEKNMVYAVCCDEPHNWALQMVLVLALRLGGHVMPAKSPNFLGPRVLMFKSFTRFGIPKSWPIGLVA